MSLDDDGDFFLLYVMANSSEGDCQQQHCKTGTPVYVDGECLCVEKPR